MEKAELGNRKETPNAQHPTPNVECDAMPARRRERRGEAGRRREPGLAWAVCRVPVFYWVILQPAEAD
jgi:hypothetical protein